MAQDEDNRGYIVVLDSEVERRQLFIQAGAMVSLKTIVETLQNAGILQHSEDQLRYFTCNKIQMQADASGADLLFHGKYPFFKIVIGDIQPSPDNDIQEPEQHMQDDKNEDNSKQNSQSDESSNNEITSQMFSKKKEGSLKVNNSSSQKGSRILNFQNDSDKSCAHLIKEVTDKLLNSEQNLEIYADNLKKRAASLTLSGEALSYLIISVMSKLSQIQHQLLKCLYSDVFKHNQIKQYFFKNFNDLFDKIIQKKQQQSKKSRDFDQKLKTITKENHNLKSSAKNNLAQITQKRQKDLQTLNSSLQSQLQQISYVKNIQQQQMSQFRKQIQDLLLQTNSLPASSNSISDINILISKLNDEWKAMIKEKQQIKNKLTDATQNNHRSIYLPYLTKQCISDLQSAICKLHQSSSSSKVKIKLYLMMQLQKDTQMPLIRKLKNTKQWLMIGKLVTGPVIAYYQTFVEDNRGLKKKHSIFCFENAANNNNGPFVVSNKFAKWIQYNHNIVIGQQEFIVHPNDMYLQIHSPMSDNGQSAYGYKAQQAQTIILNLQKQFHHKYMSKNDKNNSNSKKPQFQACYFFQCILKSQ